MKPFSRGIRWNLEGLSGRKAALLSTDVETCVEILENQRWGRVRYGRHMPASGMDTLYSRCLSGGARMDGC